MNKHQVSERLIKRDSAASVGLIKAMQDKTADIQSMYVLCLFGYFSLIAYEAFNYFNKQNNLTLQLSDSLEKARHRVKLYEDTSKGVEGVAEAIGKDMQNVHKREMDKGLIHPSLSFLQPDIGLTFVDSRLVYTTHGASYGLGLGDEESLVFDNDNARDLSEEVASSLFTLAAGETIPNLSPHLRISELSDLHYKDEHSNKLYENSFDGPSNTFINASLLTVQSRVNFIKYCIGDSDQDETILKLKYITLYTVLKSLTSLRDNTSIGLTARSNTKLNTILGDANSHLILSNGGRHLRNMLVHYDTRSFTDQNIRPGVKLFGIVETFLAGQSYESISNITEELLSMVADELNEWSNL